MTDSIATKTCNCISPTLYFFINKIDLFLVSQIEKRKTQPGTNDSNYKVSSRNTTQLLNIDQARDRVRVGFFTDPDRPVS